MANCDHNCDTCGEKCEQKDLLIHTNQYTNIKKRIGIVSGKGGVGKSLVTSLLAINSAKLGYRCAILDGDVLGPSIPKIFNIHEKAFGDETGKLIYPAHGPLNIDIISTSMLLEHEDDPIIWRGSLVSGVVQQFYSDVIYGEKDVLFIDMPPGTGDIPLTVFQSIPLDGIIIVTSPQDLVSLIVEKAVKMAKMMNIPILGLVDNYAYVVCPNCDEKIYIYGHSKNEEKAKEHQIKHYIALPLDPKISTLCDEGKLHEYKTDSFNDLIQDIMK